ncbi:MAG: NUDIX domain-containing protein [Armatimonadetes bacterium]|nr:NUDIX domain-containing protein [Armatimonadota bacterium]
MKDRDLIARAVIWKDGALLVNANHNKKTGQDYVALPGGHVDEGEGCVEALKREVEEEMAAKCVVGELLFVTENIYAGREMDEKKRHELTLFFSATLSGEQTRDDGTIWSPEPWKNFRWLPENELQSANLLPEDAKRWLTKQSVALYSFSDTRFPEGE